MNTPVAPAPSNRRKPEEIISDWYLPADNPLGGFVYPGALSIQEHPALYEMANELLKQAKQKTEQGYAEFVIKASDRAFRGHPIDTVTGRVYALRLLPLVVPPLDKLGMPAALRQILMHKKLERGGLVMVCGETGQGKSTTCAATVKERMETYGSFCLTIEDPPEMPLNGTHGKGRCLQTEVEQGQWGNAMRGAMRSYPAQSGSMLYVGETRDPETAAEVLRIATNGHLVLTTFHAESVESAIQRFKSMASAIMVESEVREVMASCFRLALHQRLKEEIDRTTQRPRKQLEMEFLISSGHISQVARKIRGAGESLNNEIQMQKMTLANQGVDGLMKMLSL